MRALVRLLFSILTLISLVSGGAAWAVPDQVVLAPKTFQRTGGAPNSATVSFALPANIIAPFLLRIENGLANGTKRSSSASVSVNGVRLAGPNDFNQQVGVIERDVAITPNNTLNVRLAGTPGSQLTISVLGTQPLSVPVSITPNPLAVSVGASGQLTVNLAPTPRQSGNIALSSDNPQIAGVPTGVAYVVGQSAVPVTVSGVTPGSAVVTATANGGSASGTVQVNQVQPTVSSLLPPTLTVTQGSNASLHVTISAAQVAPVRVNLVSSNPTVVAIPSTVTVPAGASGADVALGAIAPGTALVSATLNGGVAASEVTVTPLPPTLVSLLPATNAVTLGANLTLQLTLSAAQATATDIPLVASPGGLVNIPPVVTIPAGHVAVPVVVSTVALGTAGITASLNGASVSAAVQILPPAAAVVSLLPSPLTITQNATGNLTVRINAEQAANTEITLATDAPSLIKLPTSVIVPAGQLSATFSVTGLAVGNALVTASVNGTSQQAQIAVVPVLPQPVSLLPDPLPLQQGASGTLTLTLNAAQLTDTAFAITTSAPTIVQAPDQVVVPAGQLTASLPVSGLAAGSATLAAALNGGSAQATVNVTPPPPVPAGLAPVALSLPKGVAGTLHLTVTRAPATATIVALTSSNPLVAEIPPTVTIPAGALTADIPVIARSEGNASVSANLNGGTTTAQVTVTAPVVTALTLSPLLPTALLGDTVAFLLDATYTDASVADVTNQATWASSAPTVAPIASTGVATALAAGTATVTATFGTFTASTVVTVQTGPQLTLTPGEASVNVGSNLTLSLTSSTAAPAGGLAVALTIGGMGSLNVPATVTIPAGQTGVSVIVSGTAAGDVTLTASAPLRSPGSALIHVVPNVAITALNPTIGPVGSPVTITGLNFDPNPANNSVRFNGEPAVVGAASATELKVVVPTRATTGPVTVTTPLGTATGPAFTVQLQQDFDISLSPATLPAPPGAASLTRVSLVNKGLSPYAYAATLSVSGLPAGITATFERSSVFLGGGSSLQFTVPVGVAAGNYPVTIQATGATELGTVTRTQILTLQVLAAGTTIVTGRVIHAEDDSPFVGARVRLSGQTTYTDASGTYRFLAPAVLGSQVVLIDGSTANTDKTRYAAAIAMPVSITAGQDNPVLTSYISAVDAGKSMSIVPGNQTSVTMADLPNYSLNIPAGAVLYGWDGTPVTQVAVRTIPPDRLPIKPLPAGVETRSVYLYYFFRDGGANPTQPIPVTMINDLDADPGEQLTLWYYDESTTPDPSSNQWRVMGTGTVSADGKSIVSDPGVGIPKFCCGASFAQRDPSRQTNAATGPNAGDGCGPQTGKPVDLGSGNNLPFQHRAFGIAGLMPANLDCRYRSTDPRIGLFGRGTSFTYDWSAPVIGSTVLVTTPDGIKYPLALGADGVYRASTGRSGALGWEVRPTGDGRTLRLAQGDELDFNSNGNLMAVRDADGHRIPLTLNTYGFVSGVSDGNGRSYAIQTNSFQYGRQIYPQITRITDQIGRSVGFTYDSYGRLATYTDAGGNVTRYDYDASNRVVKRTLPTGAALTFAYDGANRTTQETLEDGVSTIQYAYQTVGSLVTQTTVTDPLGRATVYRFDGLGYVTRITDALGRVTGYTRDPATHLVTAVTDPVGRMTRYAYDAKGNVTQVTDPAGNATRFEYDPTWNRPTRITDALGQVTTRAYDDHGRLRVRTDATGATWQRTYSLQGLPLSQVDPLGHITALAYDDDGNLTAVTDPLGAVRRRNYDTANRLVESVDPLGYSTRYTRDALDRVIQTLDPNGGITAYAYDALDRLTSVTDPRGNAVEQRIYNLRGFLTQRLDAAGRATNYQYDAAGNVVQATDRKGQVTTFAYDALNRLIQTQTADGRITTREYDLAGNVAAIRDNRTGDLLFTYDALNRLIRAVSDQGSVEYAYDALGRRTQRTLDGQDPTAYRYDGVGRLTALIYRGRITAFAYDAAGRLLSKTLPNGMRQRLTWDDADRLTVLTLERGDGTVLDTVTSAYDAAGRRTQRAATLAGIPETPIDATYDASNRLATLMIAGQSYAVAYDANGNLTNKTAANGDTTTYTWDAQNRLVGIQGPNLNATFKYDALGRRVEKTVNGDTVQYLYDGAQAIAEIRGNAVAANLLTGLAVDELIARYTSQGERTLLTDALGSVLMAAKEDGTVQTAYGYSPYGETQVFGTEEGNASQYTGRENDGTGLYYYRARYYDPQLKQWPSEDPIGIEGGINTYTYVEGNPLSRTDPSGQSWKFISTAIFACGRVIWRVSRIWVKEETQTSPTPPQSPTPAQAPPPSQTPWNLPTRAEREASQTAGEVPAVEAIKLRQEGYVPMNEIPGGTPYTPHPSGNGWVAPAGGSGWGRNPGGGWR